MPKTFITADETEILVQCEKLDNEYRLYGGKSDAICKSELLPTNATAKLQSIH
jgi:hypothetical protein